MSAKRLWVPRMACLVTKKAGLYPALSAKGPGYEPPVFQHDSSGRKTVPMPHSILCCSCLYSLSISLHMIRVLIIFLAQNLIAFLHESAVERRGLGSTVPRSLLPALPAHRATQDPSPNPSRRHSCGCDVHRLPCLFRQWPLGAQM